jgi:hypothetical protein
MSVAEQCKEQRFEDTLLTHDRLPERRVKIAGLSRDDHAADPM